MQEVIHFWFNICSPKEWWQKDKAFDNEIRNRFSAVHEKAIVGELAHWRKTALGRLAEIIVLDQFSRNIFRDQAQSFAYDNLALVLAQEAVATGTDLCLAPEKRCFLYMPYMHSESLEVHHQALILFNQPGMESNYNFELKHYEIIKRFLRYPHRNEILGRISSDEELAFLKQPGSSF